MGKRMKTRLAVPSRHTWLIHGAMLACMLVLPALARAHSGMGPDEIGPPLGTAGLIGFASYWVVMLWPSSRKKVDSQTGPNNQHRDAATTGPRPRKKKNLRVKRIPHLRKVETGAQFSSEQPARRKASDG